MKRTISLPLMVQIRLAALFVAIVISTPFTALAAPEDDLHITFSSERTVTGPGNIVGTVTNRSNLRYPCVDAVFSLSTHFDDRQRGLPDVSYGDQAIRIRNIAPGSTVSFSAPLDRKAGFGFDRYELCASPMAEDTRPADTRPPQIARPCAVTGRVASRNDFVGFDDRRRREVIRYVYILNSADHSLVRKVPLQRAEARVNDRRSGRSYKTRSYKVSGLPGKRRYIATLSRAWRTDPAEIPFGCPDPRGRQEFNLPNLFHIGNRLGG
ncbi:MAG: hypothetical protein ACU85E_05135 [Gammaproteobacteria bacterium]